MGPEGLPTTGSIGPQGKHQSDFVGWLLELGMRGEPTGKKNSVLFPRFAGVCWRLN